MATSKPTTTPSGVDQPVVVELDNSRLGTAAGEDDDDLPMIFS